MLSELAKTSSQCPMCHRFISKNRSWVCRLPKPIAPRAAEDELLDGWYSIDTGEAYNFGGRKPTSSPRWYVHEYCFEAALEVLQERTASV